MVKGIDTFRQYFRDDTDKYVLIGGAACDTIFSNREARFRATRDLDMVLIVEALTPDFGVKLWNFINDGSYHNKATASGKPQFFRFSDPANEDYPQMIELFARTDYELAEPGILTPVHIDDSISSLSAILLNDDYYNLLLTGSTVINDLSVLRPEYLILFKAKAYLDLREQYQSGGPIHSSEFKKHKRDILRISVELLLESPGELPAEVINDINSFIDSLYDDPFDQNTLQTYGITTDAVVERLRALYFQL